MLQKLRDKTSGWIASVIFGLLLIPFSFFGVEQYMHSKTETWSAKIEAPPTWWAGAPHWWPASMLWTREEISNQDFRQRFEQERQAQRQELGAAYDPRAFETPDTKRRIIDEMIDQRVMQMAATRAGVSISDAQVQKAIMDMPVFQVDGRFNKERYQFALASQQMAPSTFEKDVREGLQVDLLPSGLNESSFVTKSEMDRVLKLLAEQRTVSYVQLPPPVADNGPVKGAEIDAYYRTHHSEFRAPETVSIEYVDVDAATLSVPPADEAALRAASPNWDAIAELAQATESMGLFVYARSADPVHYYAVRAFVGAPARFEDAASGAANATLAAWLAARGALPSADGRYRVSQGREVGHDAIIDLQVDADGEVWSGGRVCDVVTGEIDWPAADPKRQQE